MDGDEKYSYYDEAGRLVHVFEDKFGTETKITEQRMSDYIFQGEQWCPYCKRTVEHDDENEVWRCSVCGWNIGDDEVAQDGGIPSLAAALDFIDEYGY